MFFCPTTCVPTAAILCVGMAVLEPCGAQSDGNAPLLLELPASTRALGIGGAFVLSVSESDALFHNQGALVGEEGVGVSVQRYG